MPSDVQSTKRGNRHNGPPSPQKHHTADSHDDGENYSDALETQAVPTKTADGNGPMKPLTNGPHDQDQPSSRPSTSSSDELGADIFQDNTARDSEILENLTVKPSTDKAVEPERARMIARPADAPTYKPGITFKFAGGPKLAVVPRQIPPQTREQMKGQLSPQYESSRVPTIALQAPPVPVQATQASTLPSLSSSSKAVTEARASDSSSFSQVSSSQIQTSSIGQSERPSPIHPESSPSTYLERSPTGLNKAETSTVAHAVSDRCDEDMVVDSTEASNVEQSSFPTEAFTSVAPGPVATPSSALPRAGGSASGRPSQASVARPKSNKNNRIEGGSPRRSPKDGGKHVGVGNVKDLFEGPPINISNPSPTAPAEEHATVAVDNHQPPLLESSEQDVGVAHTTVVKTIETAGLEETRTSTPPLKGSSKRVDITHDNHTRSLGESDSVSVTESEAQSRSQHCDGEDMEVELPMAQSAAATPPPSHTISKVPEDKPVEISQQDFESASKNDRDIRSPSPSPVNRPLQSRSQPAQADAVLHSVSGRARATKVTKGVSRTKKSDYISFLAQQVPPGLHEVFGRLEFAVAEDTRLRRCLVEIFDQLLKDKDAEIEDALKANDDLASQLEDNHAKQAELRGKLEAFGPRAKRLVKFLNGIGNDMNSLKTSQSEIYATIDELAAHNMSVAAQKTSLLDMKHEQSELSRNLNELRDDTREAYQSLLLEKESLQRKLNRREGQIVEANDLSAVLKKQLESPTQQYVELEKLIKESHDKTIKGLSTVHELIGSRKDEELLRIVKKCSEQMGSFCRQGQNATERLGELKTTVEGLSFATQNHFKDVKATQELDRVADFETRVSGLLEAMKTDIRSQEDLTAKAASLKEAISVLQEQFRSSETKVVELKSQLAGHKSQESALKQHIDQLEAKKLQHEQSSSTSIESRFRETTSENSTLQQEVTKTKAEATAYAAQAEELQRTRDGLQQRLSEAENQLAEARRAFPDFGPERAKLEEKARQDLREHKLRSSRMAQGNQNRHAGEVLQIKAYREAAEKKLSTALSELDPVKSENQNLKEEATSSKNKIDTLTAELDAKATQLRQLNADSIPERERNETLQRQVTELQPLLREAQSAARMHGDECVLLQDELRSANKNLTESDAAKKTLESRLGQAESAAREQEEKHRSEISILRRNNEETCSRLKLAEDNTAKLQEIVDAQARRDVRDFGSQTPSQAQGRIQRPGTADSSQEYGSGPTNQELLQIEEQSSEARPKKTLKRVDRNQSINSRSSRVQSTSSQEPHIEVFQSTLPGSQSSRHVASSQGPRVEGPQSTVPETQHDDEDMLDNRRPNSQGSSTGYDASAIDKQVLDENGVRDAEESQSQLPKASQRNYLPTTFETQSQVDPFSVEETQERSSSSPLTSPRPEHLAYKQIAAEETSANIASQKRSGRKTVDVESQESVVEGVSGTTLDSQPTWSQHGISATMQTTQDLSPRLHGNGAISQGKKRDPLQSTPGIKAARNLPRQASQKQSQRGSSYYDEEDISDLEPFTEATPAKSSRKRSASQRGAVDHSGSKRLRSTPGPVAKSSAGKEGSSKFGSTPERGSSSTRHHSIFNQPSSARTSSLGASPAQKQRSSKKIQRSMNASAKKRPEDAEATLKQF